MIKRGIIVVVSVVLFFTLSGCGSSKGVVLTKRELPLWYEKPLSSTQKTLYSIASGKSKEAAVTNALSMMLSTLSVSVSSKYSSKSEELNNHITTHSTLDIESEVKKIRIGNYKVINQKRVGFKNYVVQIASDKQELFHSLHQELQQKFTLAHLDSRTLQKLNALEQLQRYEKLDKSLQRLQSTLLVMHSLDATFDGNEFIEMYRKNRKNITKLHSKISFSVVSDNQGLNLHTSIMSAINLKGFKIKDENSRFNFRVKIKTTINRAQSYGFILARAAVIIEVLDSKNSVIGSNKLHIVGQSTQGYKVAQESVSQKLKRVIKKDGIEKVLGLDF